jgi:chorismate dehydratase
MAEMTRLVRLGAVDYLNVRPLVYELEGRRDRLSLRFDVPAVCAQLLDSGDIDLGMVPTITYLDRPGDRIVPGVCIGSEGAVASVALFHRRPLRDVRSVALDTSSRTSAALTRILCARRFDISPVFVPHAPNLDSMLSVADAALLIGDPALFVDYQASGAMKTDLGAEWAAMTGLPFVWAFWSGREGAAAPDVVGLLQNAAVDGMQHSDAIADAYLAGNAGHQAIGRRYLRENLMFRLTPRAIAGLETYYREAVAAGLAPREHRPEFFPEV